MATLGCDARGLDKVLLLPIEDTSGPLPAKLAPRVFGQINSSGRNPDGYYWRELDGQGDRFNLANRVAERLHGSKKWLLKEFLPYFGDEPPPVQESAEHLVQFLEQRAVVFLPDYAAYALEEHGGQRYKSLKEYSLELLIKAATPETLLFLFAFFHLQVWRRNRRAVRYLHHIALQAVREFVSALESRGFENAFQIAGVLGQALGEAAVAIEQSGDRSPRCRFAPILEFIPPSPLLVSDSSEVRDALICLKAASPSWYEVCFPHEPVPYETHKGSAWAPTNASVGAAIYVVSKNLVATHDAIRKEFETAVTEAAGLLPVQIGKGSARGAGRCSPFTSSHLSSQ